MTENYYTVPEVETELKDEDDKVRFEYFKNAGLNLQSPDPDSVKSIEELSMSTGDSSRLSPIDKLLLALSMDLQAVIITDDYSIQNIASVIGIEYLSLSEKGIKQVIHWQLKCKGCGRIWDEPHQECPVCGESLKTSFKRTKQD